MELVKTRKALNRARKDFENFTLADSFEDREYLWNNFLNGLDKIYKKSNDEVKLIQAGDYNKLVFFGWRSEVVHLRKKDPLLTFLRNARNAEEHSVQEVTQIAHKMDITSPKEGEVFTEGDIITVTGNVYETIQAVIFFNEGIKYELPEQHLGKPLNDPKDPFEMGKLALNFYENYIRKIEQDYLER